MKLPQTELSVKCRPNWEVIVLFVNNTPALSPEEESVLHRRLI